MQTLMTIFMMLICVICLFAVIVITRDIISDSADRRLMRDAENAKIKLAMAQALAPAAPVAPAVEVKPEPVIEVKPEPVVETKPEPVVEVVEEVKEEPVVEEVKEEPVVEVVEEVKPEPVLEEVAVAQDDENAVKFSTSTISSLDDKYMSLSSEYKSYYDEVVRHANSKENVKVVKNDRYEEYKIGNTRLIRLLIKRGVVMAEFIFLDRNLKAYRDASDVKVKQAPTSMKIVSLAGVAAAKDGIDLVITQIAEEKEYKKQLARERRRKKAE